MQIVPSNETSKLTERDFEMFGHLGIPPELVRRAGVVRVTDAECRQRYGINGSGDRTGIVFPYYSRHDGHRVTARVRLDNPPIENGKLKGKYRTPYGDKRHLYSVRGTGLGPHTAVTLVEAEKSVLALTAWAERTGADILPIGMGGCWGWRGRIGKVDGPKGERLDEKGALPELAQICSKDREVYIMLDANAATNPDVRVARAALSSELLNYGCRVRIATIPVIEEVNGPDDLIGTLGDKAMADVLELSAPALDVAVADAEEAIAAVVKSKPKIDAERCRTALDAIAVVPDNFQRKVLEGRLSSALKGSGITKETITKGVRDRINRQAEKKAAAANAVNEAELLQYPLDSRKLISDLEKFFSERAYLPNGAALMLAYFTLNAHVFEAFDTTPYLSLESATPGCGKSTVLRLLESLCERARKATSLSEAALFRLLDAEKPVLLIDEAKVLEGNSDRGELLRAVLHEGYKAGGQVPRCEGDDHDVRWFDVYSPKAIAEIGGLSGALLDRCIVIHMEKAPRGHRRKTSRIRALKRDAATLLKELKAYTIQAKSELERLYYQEPDEGYWPWIQDREAELYGPLLIHARLIGKDTEQKLLAVVEKFTNAKAEIQAEDWHIAKTIALLGALEELAGDTFTPGDIVDGLADSEVWSLSFAKARSSDEKARHKEKSAKVGYFLRSYRIKGSRVGGTVRYNRKTVIEIIRAHTPQNYPNYPELNQSSSQPAETTGQQYDINLQDSSENVDQESQNYPASLERCSQDTLRERSGDLGDAISNHPAPQPVENTSQQDRQDRQDSFAGSNRNTDLNPGTFPADDGECFTGEI